MNDSTTLTMGKIEEAIEKVKVLGPPPGKLIVHGSQVFEVKEPKYDPKIVWEYKPRSDQWLDTSYAYAAPYMPVFAGISVTLKDLNWKVRFRERVKFLSSLVGEKKLDFGVVVNTLLKIAKKRYSPPAILAPMLLGRVMRELDNPSDAISRTILGLMSDLRKHVHGPLRRKVDSELVFHEL